MRVVFFQHLLETFSEAAEAAKECGRCGGSLLASLSAVVYVDSMRKVQPGDPFVSNEPEVEVDTATSRILKQRMKTADDEGRLVPTNAARQRIRRWLSKSFTTKTR